MLLRLAHPYASSDTIRHYGQSYGVGEGSKPHVLPSSSEDPAANRAEHERPTPDELRTYSTCDWKSHHAYHWLKLQYHEPNNQYTRTPIPSAISGIITSQDTNPTCSFPSTSKLYSPVKRRAHPASAHSAGIPFHSPRTELRTCTATNGFVRDLSRSLEDMVVCCKYWRYGRKRWSRWCRVAVGELYQRVAATKSCGCF